TWMVVVTVAATLTAGALGWFAVERQRASEEAETARRASEARTAIARREVQEARDSLAVIERELRELDALTDQALARLATQQTAAEERATQARLRDLQRAGAAARERIRLAKLAQDAKERKDGVHIDRTCATGVFCGDSKPGGSKRRK
nr:hypothetical protein [Myxococcota bacterium]